MSEERYERALSRYHYVWDSLFSLDFDARVPGAYLEPDGKRRTVVEDWSHATVNVPVEYARWQWGWSQVKTKIFMPYVLIRMWMS
jgi:hypothetical protein